VAESGLGACASTRSDAAGAPASIDFAAEASGPGCLAQAPPLDGPSSVTSVSAAAPTVTARWLGDANRIEWSADQSGPCRVETSRDEGATWTLARIGWDAEHLDSLSGPRPCAMDRYRVACRGSDGWSPWAVTSIAWTRLESGQDGLVTAPEQSPYLASGTVSISGDGAIDVRSGTMICMDGNLSLTAPSIVIESNTTIAINGWTLKLNAGAPTDPSLASTDASAACSVSGEAGGSLTIMNGWTIAPPVDTSSVACFLSREAAPSVDLPLAPDPLLVTGRLGNHTRIGWTPPGMWRADALWGSDSCTLERSHDGGATWDRVLAGQVTSFGVPFDACEVTQYRVSCTNGGVPSGWSVVTVGNRVTSTTGALIATPEGSPWVVDGAVRLDVPLDLRPGADLCLRPGASLSLRDDGVYAR
jgi:hypothetical protein